MDSRPTKIFNPATPANRGRLQKKRKAQKGNGTKSAKRPKVAARPDTLDWKAVPMPDRLDDYEGFFGLEEVDGIEVVRDDATGRTSYLASRLGKPHLPVPTNVSKAEIDPGEYEEEWFGFSEDAAPSSKPVASEIGTRKSLLKSKKQKENKKSQMVKPPKSNHLETVEFNHLPDANKYSHVSVEAWKSLNLSPDIMASLSHLGFATPTPIQEASIPYIIDGHDLIGKASTGSGKTLAFGIPILQRFLELRTKFASLSERPRPTAPLALILSPTRELAHQIEKHLKALFLAAIDDGPQIATLTGGLSIQKQQRLLKDADIVIGTPGRLWEIVSSGHGTISALKRIQFLIVDEADRLLSDGHFREVEDILQVLDQENVAVEDNMSASTTDSLEVRIKDNQNRQTLVFSATFDQGLQKKLASKVRTVGGLLSNEEATQYLLSKLHFRQDPPKFIDVNPIKQLANGLKEGLVECSATEKDLYLYSLLLLYPNTRALVFTNSISAVRRLTPFLQNLQLPAAALHSGMIQKARLRSVEHFAKEQDSGQQSSILVATDVAARGLDIPNVQLVIHYHLPRAADTYVHRSGRTARAGQTGSSVLICGPEEVAGVRRLVAKVHSRSADENVSTPSADAARAGYYIRTLDIDRRIVARLKPRAVLAKRLADTTQAKEKSGKESDFFRAAAEELGVHYNSSGGEDGGPASRGRGNNRRKKAREAASLSKGEMAALRAELQTLLRQRVNVGVSERYLTSGGVDIDELLRHRDAVSGAAGQFLGSVQGVQMD